jgi:hypothetical protein
MNKYPLIGVSICAVVLLVLGSLTNVVGYQSVQSSNQKIINEEVNQKELLFQTIVDIVNNKEIQQIILKSQLSKEGFFNLSVRFPVFSNPVLTKNQLKQMYLIGMMLSKFINKSKIHSIIQQYQLSNSGTQQGISAVINKDATLNEEITQLSALNCDCNNDNYKEKVIPGNICIILFCIFLTILAPSYILSVIFHNTPLLWLIVAILIELPSFLVAMCCLFLMAFVFNCWGSIPTH